MSMLRPARGQPFALVLLALAAVLAYVPDVAAQVRLTSGLPSPRLLVVSPAGAKAGTSVEVTCFGQNLEDIERVAFSHQGIKAEVVGVETLPVEPKKGKGKGKGKMPASAPGIVKLKITVPNDAPLGAHDMRIVNKWGASNPRVFVVGDLPEVQEKEPNNEDTQAQRVEINTTINGAINGPTDVDYYVFKGKKGQRVVVSCLASSIDSRLQPAIEIYGAKDVQLATNSNYRGSDALADATLPDDGDYYVRVIQFTHVLGGAIPGGLPGGATDHFYRLTITTAPWIDAIHPVVLEPGKTTSVTIHGRNLPGGKLDPAAVVGGNVLEKITVDITTPTMADAHKAQAGARSPLLATVDGFEYRTRNSSGASNAFLLTLAQAPVVLDKGGNDTPDTAQEISLPCEIAGVVEKRRDRDWYTFSVKKGESYNIEMFSSRLGAPTFPAFILRQAPVKGVAVGQEFDTRNQADNMQGYARRFFNRSDDPPVYRFTAPADAKYQLLVLCRGGDTLAGPRHTYRVRITRDQPDFHLVAMADENAVPASPTVFAGGNQAFTVFAWRHDGFAGDIALSVEGLPPGVTCPPQVLNGSMRQATLVVSAAPGAAAWTGPIKIKGTATILGKPVVHEARSASIVWPVQPQQNIPTISRLDHAVMLAVRGQAPFSARATLDKAVVTAGDKATLKVKLDRLWPDLKAPLDVQSTVSQQRQGVELPNNLKVNNNAKVTVAPAQKEATLAITIGADVPPGDYNIVAIVQGQIPYNKDPMAKAKANTPIVQPSTPVTLTVLPKSLAKLTLSTANATLKAGGQAEVTVRAQRLHGHDGELKVQLVPGPASKGVEAVEVVIPAGQEEAKLVLKAPAQAMPGQRSNLTVRAVAMFRSTPITHEIKLNVNVVK